MASKVGDQTKGGGAGVVSDRTDADFQLKSGPEEQPEKAATGFSAQSDPKAPPAPQRKNISRLSLSSPAHLLSRLETLNNSTVPGFKEFLEKFSPFEECRAAVASANLMTDYGRLPELEAQVKLLEDTQALFITKNAYAHLFQTKNIANVENDEIFKKIKSTDPGWALQLVRAFDAVTDRLKNLRQHPPEILTDGLQKFEAWEKEAKRPAEFYERTPVTFQQLEEQLKGLVSLIQSARFEDFFALSRVPEPTKVEVVPSSAPKLKPFSFEKGQAVLRKGSEDFDIVAVITDVSQNGEVKVEYADGKQSRWMSSANLLEQVASRKEEGWFIAYYEFQKGQSLIRENGDSFEEVATVMGTEAESFGESNADSPWILKSRTGGKLESISSGDLALKLFREKKSGLKLALYDSTGATWKRVNPEKPETLEAIDQILQALEQMAKPPSAGEGLIPLLRSHKEQLERLRQATQAQFSAWIQSKERNLSATAKSYFKGILGKDFADASQNVAPAEWAKWEKKIARIDQRIALTETIIKNIAEGAEVSSGISPDEMEIDGTLLELAESQRRGEALSFEDHYALSLARLRKLDFEGDAEEAFSTYASLQTEYLATVPEIQKLPSGECSFTARINRLLAEGVLETTIPLVVTSDDLIDLKGVIISHILKTARPDDTDLGTSPRLDVREIDVEIARLARLEAKNPKRTKLINKAQAVAKEIAKKQEPTRLRKFTQGFVDLVDDPNLYVVVLAGTLSGGVGGALETELVASDVLAASGLEKLGLIEAKMAISGIAFLNAMNAINMGLTRTDHLDFSVAGNLHSIAIMWWLEEMQGIFRNVVMPKYFEAMGTTPLRAGVRDFVITPLGSKTFEVAGMTSFGLGAGALTHGEKYLTADKFEEEFFSAIQYTLAFGALHAARGGEADSPAARGLDLAARRLEQTRDQIRKFSPSLEGRGQGEGDLAPLKAQGQKQFVAYLKAAQTFLEERIKQLEWTKKLNPSDARTDAAIEDLRKKQTALAQGINDLQRVPLKVIPNKSPSEAPLRPATKSAADFYLAPDRQIISAEETASINPALFSADDARFPPKAVKLLDGNGKEKIVILEHRNYEAGMELLDQKSYQDLVGAGGYSPPYEFIFARSEAGEILGYAIMGGPYKGALFNFIRWHKKNRDNPETVQQLGWAMSAYFFGGTRTAWENQPPESFVAGNIRPWLLMSFRSRSYDNRTSPVDTSRLPEAHYGITVEEARYIISLFQFSDLPRVETVKTIVRYPPPPPTAEGTVGLDRGEERAPEVARVEDEVRAMDYSGETDRIQESDFFPGWGQQGYFLGRGLELSNSYAASTQFGKIESNLRQALDAKRAKGDRSPLRLLTIGPGQGNMEADLKNIFHGDIVIDVFSLTSVLTAQARASIRKEYIGNINVHDLPAGYDRIIAINSVNTAEQSRVIKQVVGALVPGGEAVVILGNDQVSGTASFLNPNTREFLLNDGICLGLVPAFPAPTIVTYIHKDHDVPDLVWPDAVPLGAKLPSYRYQITKGGSYFVYTFEGNGKEEVKRVIGERLDIILRELGYDADSAREDDTFKWMVDTVYGDGVRKGIPIDYWIRRHFENQPETSGFEEFKLGPGSLKTARAGGGSGRMPGDALMSAFPPESLLGRLAREKMMARGVDDPAKLHVDVLKEIVVELADALSQSSESDSALLPEARCLRDLIHLMRIHFQFDPMESPFADNYLDILDRFGLTTTPSQVDTSQAKTFEAQAPSSSALAKRLIAGFKGPNELMELSAKQADKFGGLYKITDADLPQHLRDLFSQIYIRFVDNPQPEPKDVKILHSLLAWIDEARQEGLVVSLDHTFETNARVVARGEKMPGPEIPIRDVGGLMRVIRYQYPEALPFFEESLIGRDATRPSTDREEVQGILLDRLNNLLSAVYTDYQYGQEAFLYSAEGVFVLNPERYAAAKALRELVPRFEKDGIPLLQKISGLGTPPGPELWAILIQALDYKKAEFKPDAPMPDSSKRTWKIARERALLPSLVGNKIPLASVEGHRLEATVGIPQRGESFFQLGVELDGKFTLGSFALKLTDDGYEIIGDLSLSKAQSSLNAGQMKEIVRAIYAWIAVQNNRFEYAKDPGAPALKTSQVTVAVDGYTREIIASVKGDKLKSELGNQSDILLLGQQKWSKKPEVHLRLTLQRTLVEAEKDFARIPFRWPRAEIRELVNLIEGAETQYGIKVDTARLNRVKRYLAGRDPTDRAAASLDVLTSGVLAAAGAAAGAVSALAGFFGGKDPVKVMQEAMGRKRDLQEPKPGPHSNAPAVILLAQSPTAKDLVIQAQDDITIGVGDNQVVAMAGDKTVSRQHCRIKKVGDGWVIEDLGSANGTRLNGKVLKMVTEYPIKPGDQISVGRSEWTFGTAEKIPPDLSAKELVFLNALGLYDLKDSAAVLEALLKIFAAYRENGNDLPVNYQSLAARFYYDLETKAQIRFTDALREGEIHLENLRGLSKTLRQDLPKPIFEFLYQLVAESPAPLIPLLQVALNNLDYVKALELLSQASDDIMLLKPGDDPEQELLSRSYQHRTDPRYEEVIQTLREKARQQSAQEGLNPQQLAQIDTWAKEALEKAAALKAPQPRVILHKKASVQGHDLPPIAGMIDVPTPPAGPSNHLLNQLPARLAAAGQLLIADLENFAEPKGEVREVIDELSGSQLQGFARGDVIKAKLFGLVHKRERRLRGSDTVHLSSSSEETFTAYQRWQEVMGFPESTDVSQNPGASAKLIQYGKSVGVDITLREGIPISTLQVEYIEALLRLLPKKLLQSGYLKNILVGSEHHGGDDAGGSVFSFRERKVYLFSGTLVGSRRALLAILLHEIGHSSENHYDQLSGSAPTAPLRVRNRLHECFDIIRGKTPGRENIQNVVYSLDWRSDGKRLEYTSKNFHEFIAEFHIFYVLDGAGLRAHIQKLKADPATRDQGEAYEEIYNEFKERIFGGVEYEGSSIKSPAASPPAPVVTRYGKRLAQALPEHSPLYDDFLNVCQKMRKDPKDFDQSDAMTFLKQMAGLLQARVLTNLSPAEAQGFMDLVGRMVEGDDDFLPALFGDAKFSEAYEALQARVARSLQELDVVRSRVSGAREIKEQRVDPKQSEALKKSLQETIDNSELLNTLKGQGLKAPWSEVPDAEVPEILRGAFNSLSGVWGSSPADVKVRRALSQLYEKIIEAREAGFVVPLRESDFFSFRNAMILEGDREAVTNGGVYYAAERNAIGSDGDARFTVHAVVDPVTGRILAVGSEKDLRLIDFEEGKRVTFHIATPFITDLSATGNDILELLSDRAKQLALSDRLVKSIQYTLEDYGDDPAVLLKIKNCWIDKVTFEEEVSPDAHSALQRMVGMPFEYVPNSPL